MRNEHRFTKPPQPLQRAQMDNLTLIPGSVLPQIEWCQQLANALPAGGVLVVVPPDNPKQKQALLAVAKLLAQEGHQVKVKVIVTSEITCRLAAPQLSFNL